MAITPWGGVQTLHCLYMAIETTTCCWFFSEIWFIYTKTEEVLRQSLFLWMSIVQGCSRWSQLALSFQVLGAVVTEVEIQPWKKAEITKSVWKSMTRWRLWLEESISMVTAVFAKGRGEVKEACCFFLALIQLDHKLQYWQDFSGRTKQNINEETVGKSEKMIDR